jgi:DNA-binding LytR/AlgR family response regulator
MNQVPIDQSNKGPIPAYRHIQDLDQLVHLEGAGNYTLLYLLDSVNPLLVSTTLKYFEQQLSGFIRLSKGILINPQFISKVTREGHKLLLVELSTGAKFLVARRRIDYVLQRVAKTRMAQS